MILEFYLILPLGGSQELPWAPGPNQVPLFQGVCSNEADGLMPEKKMNVSAFHSVKSREFGQTVERVCMKIEELKTGRYVWDLERSLV